MSTMNRSHRPLGALLIPMALLASALSPAAWAETQFNVPVEEVTSPAGTTFWHVEAPLVPIVTVDIVFVGGARLDPEGKEGATRLVTALLDEGSADLDAVAASDRLNELNARISYTARRDTVRVDASMLVERMRPSAEFLNDTLTEPRFDPDAIERVRTQLLASIASDETDPNARARDAFFARSFPGHPFARRTDGTAESVGSITREDLLEQHSRMMSLDRAYIAVVGDLDAAAAGELVDIMLAGIPATAPDDAALPPAPEGTPPPGIEVVELEIPQSVAIFGHAGMERSDPDYIPAFVMNYILGGGGFSSRLMTEVREKRGLAYGVYAYLSTLDGAPLYIGSVQTENARIGESLDVIRAEWQRMAEGGVTDEELANAKRYLTGAFPLRFDSNGKIAGFLSAAQEFDLGLDYIEKRNGLVEAVTAEDIARIAKRLLDEDALSIVVVGQPAGL
ncbi:MAG: pitrilysin family protein [Pseudomonadota bacterium]